LFQKLTLMYLVAVAVSVEVVAKVAPVAVVRAVVLALLPQQAHVLLQLVPRLLLVELFV
jgi:hypothetical protein